MKAKKETRGRPAKGRETITFAIARPVAVAAEQQRLRQQAAEGRDIAKVDWFSRLITEALERY